MDCCSGSMTCGPTVGTLGGATRCCGLWDVGVEFVARSVGGFGTLGARGVCSAAGFAVTEKMFANVSMAAICLSPIAAKGDAGAGFWIAQHRSMAARMAASADDSAGIFPKCGMNSTVHAIRSARVLVAYTR